MGGLQPRVEADAIHSAAADFHSAKHAISATGVKGSDRGRIAEELPGDGAALSSVSVTAPFLTDASVEVRVAFAKATSDVNREPLLKKWRPWFSALFGALGQTPDLAAAVTDVELLARNMRDLVAADVDLTPFDWLNEVADEADVLETFTHLG